MPDAVGRTRDVHNKAQELIPNWINDLVTSYRLIPLRYAIRSVSPTDYSCVTYQLPSEIGDGLICFFNDGDTLMITFSITLKKTIEHFQLPGLDESCAVLYFDEANACSFIPSLSTPPREFSDHKKDPIEPIFPNTFYLKSTDRFHAIRCQSEAIVSGIFLITRDPSCTSLFYVPDTFFCSSNHHHAIESMMIDLLHYSYNGKTAELFFKGKIQEFLSYLIFEQGKSFKTSPSDLKKSSAGKWIQKSEEEDILHIMKYISQHPDVNVSGEELIREAHMSLAKLKYCFKDLTGMTLGEYKKNVQLKKACQLLRTSEIKIPQIARLCGFQSSTSFGAFFKKHMGLSPLQYRKNA